jgi:DNA-directed RNA polymerase subunit RPC12/RpoP
MDALKLYSLKTLPQFDTSVEKRPAKRPKIQIAQKNAVEYICESCKEPIFLSTNDLVHCDNCDNRIVSKTTNNKSRTYEAV